MIHSILSPNQSILRFKPEIPFVADSYDNNTKATLINPTFLKDLFEFSEMEKDNINEETVGFLQPYVDLQTPDGMSICIKMRSFLMIKT